MEFPAFLPIEQGILRVGKFKEMLHIPASDMCFVFVFIWISHSCLEVPLLKSKKFQNDFSYSASYHIYNPGAYLLCKWFWFWHKQTLKIFFIFNKVGFRSRTNMLLDEIQRSQTSETERCEGICITPMQFQALKKVSFLQEHNVVL